MTPKQTRERRQELIEIVQKLTKHMTAKDTYTQEELEWLVDINIKLLAIIKTL